MRATTSPVVPRAGTVIFLALSLALFFPLGAAQENTTEPPPEDVWTVYTEVDATVHDNYAIVQVTEHIDNLGPDPEFPFEVRIPDTAFITGLTITRDGETYEASVEPREQARAHYEEAKQAGQSAGLVEKDRHSSVYRYLVNVEATESLTATLTYETYLTAQQGVHTLDLEAPVSGFGRDTGARFHVEVLHEDGLDGLWSTPQGKVHPTADPPAVTYQVGPREHGQPTPFSVHYSVASTEQGGALVATVENGTGYFAHRFRADVDQDRLPLDLSLVLDTSGSMSGEKIDQLQDAATQVVSQLEERDRLHLTFFASGAHVPWDALEPATPVQRGEAAEAIEHAVASGGTNAQAGLGRGFQALDAARVNGSEGVPVVAFLTDGQANTGIRDPVALSAWADEANHAEAPIYALAFGEWADWSLVHTLATDHGGAALRVPTGQGAEVDIRSFLTALTGPVLKDVQVTYDQDVNASSATGSVLFQGSEILIVGTFNATGQDRLTGNATMVGPEGNLTIPFEETIRHEQAAASYLPRLVAYHQVRQLEDELDARGTDEALEASIAEIATHHGFVTSQTSLVLSLPHQDLAEEREEDADNQATASDRDGQAAGSGGHAASSPPPSASSPSSPESDGGDGGAGPDADDAGGSDMSDGHAAPSPPSDPSNQPAPEGDGADAGVGPDPDGAGQSPDSDGDAQPSSPSQGP
ncbi:MAG: VIT domain-containing protein, partial [Candidatus Thermoplasmatota archaeon]|nr:VIT domain-containing protein [Candidatus Thermoplasmatota archaeon]